MRIPDDREVITPARTLVVEIPETKSISGKPVPETVIDAIIDLKLRGMTESAISRELNVDDKTVVLHWRRYLRARSEARLSDTAVAFAELIERLNQNALDARAAFYATVENSAGTAQKFLSTERQALDSLARIGVERDDAPLQAARVQAAQATVLAGLIREVVSKADLTHSDKAILMASFSLALRGVTALPETVVIEVEQ